MFSGHDRTVELEPTVIVVACARSSQYSSRDPEGTHNPWPLAEELLAVDGYQAGEGHFSLGS